MDISRIFFIGWNQSLYFRRWKPASPRCDEAYGSCDVEVANSTDNSSNIKNNDTKRQKKESKRCKYWNIDIFYNWHCIITKKSLRKQGPFREREIFPRPRYSIDMEVNQEFLALIPILLTRFQNKKFDFISIQRWHAIIVDFGM